MGPHSLLDRGRTRLRFSCLFHLDNLPSTPGDSLSNNFLHHTYLSNRIARLIDLSPRLVFTPEHTSRTLLFSFFFSLSSYTYRVRPPVDHRPPAPVSCILLPQSCCDTVRGQTRQRTQQLEDQFPAKAKMLLCGKEATQLRPWHGNATGPLCACLSVLCCTGPWQQDLEATAYSVPLRCSRGGCDLSQLVLTLLLMPIRFERKLSRLPCPWPCRK